MSTTTAPRRAASRLRWTVIDSRTIAGRTVAHWVRRPGLLIAGLAFPIMIVLMFGFLFGGQMSVPGGGEYIEFLLPGMFVMTVTFGIEATILAVTTDAERGSPTASGRCRWLARRSWSAAVLPTWPTPCSVSPR